MSGYVKRAALFICLALTVVSGRTGRAQAPVPNALTFFKNYFVTGDYVVAGVNLRDTGVNGFAHGEIHFPADPNNEVPVNADILAAFLYWQTIVPENNSALGYTGAMFRGNLLQSDDPVPQTIAYSLNPQGNAPCWSSGGGTGGAQGSRKMRAFRADVLRFLPIGTDPTKPNFGKRLVNDADLTAHGEAFHTVDLPDSGQGNGVPSTAGASLVVIYRDTRDDLDSNPTNGLQRPALRSIVIYNGGWTMDNDTDYMQQVITGLYQASSGIPAAKMTNIVADGQPNFSEQVLFKGSAQGTLGVLVPAPGPFAGTASTSSTPAWDNWTYYNLPLAANAAEATVRVDHDSFTPFDCLSWGAILLSTTVEDPDEDGIVSALEAEATSGQVADPTGALLPDLYAMGARPDHKDLFIEFGYLKADFGYTNPTQGDVDPHTHLITKAALTLVGDAFKNAPVSNPDSVTGIKVHFDVGNNYQNLSNTDPAKPYIIPFRHANGEPCSLPASGHTFDTACLARGGESIDETACVPGPLNGFECGFPAYRGVVGWKVGFRFLRDQGIDDPTTVANEGDCVTAPNTCSRRFDRTRKDIFHYALFPHALGVQRLDDPNTTDQNPTTAADDESVATVPPTPGIVDVDPVASGVQTPVPVGVSGTGDGGGSGGADLMVTLGFWDGFVGTDFIQASTLMHELGHNFGLRHGPTYLSNGLLTVQNCQPNYQSVMNYLFQIRGFIVGATNIPVLGFQPADHVIDYSRKPLPAVTETSLSEPAGLGTMNYLGAWYANQTAESLTGLDLTASKRHCDGSFLSANEYTQFLGNNGMVRVVGSSITAPINWDMDTQSNETGIEQDVTFNGFKTSLVASGDEWGNVDLRQVGSRRNVASFAIEDTIGPLSLDMGQGDNGQGDNGQGANGQGDNGQGDNGQGDNGQGDNGQGDNGQGDNGSPPEIDREAAADPPYLLTPVVVKQGIRLTWTPAHLGTVDHYEVWRSVGTVLSPTKTFVGSTTATTFIDTTAKKNVIYTYVVVVHNTDDTNYMSNPQTIFFK